MKRVLVTGATGFVGTQVCELLAARGFSVRAALRHARPLPPHIAERAIVGDITSTTNWEDALREVSCVVHLAARAHVMNDTPANADLYAETNARGTRRLAEAAARAGVRGFVFLSSVKVNGEQTTGRPYAASDAPDPKDAYGRSKWQAEQFLAQVAARDALPTAAVRSPLVYGPGVRANFLRLLRWVDRQVPLPFARVSNRRSLVSVWNLSDLVVRLAEQLPAGSSTWMVSDGEDLSTPELIRRLGVALGRKPRLLPVPVSMLRALGAVTGHSAEVKRLCGSLVVDCKTTRDELRWAPALSVDEGLRRTAHWYRSVGVAHAR